LRAGSNTLQNGQWSERSQPRATCTACKRLKDTLGTGGTAVLAEIEKVLAMDKSMFFQSIYVQQGEIEELVTAKPGVRKGLMSRLLGMEDLQKAWKTCDPSSTDLKENQRSSKGN